MALSRGDHLGPYEIVGLLGAGGMGEVYRARDLRLDRDVAIKVLPEEVGQDPHRRRRFHKEARAAGALDHPNILAVHDVGAHHGRPYLVTELLEGETLRERMTVSSLPLLKAIDYAVQITRGLAAAHDKGIVHRDLKPENLFVTKDGLVKVLDFGLAKMRGPQAQPRRIGDDVETASRTTEPGAAIGTAGYMSPEQVRGQAVDHRSDIFSFGAVLYEMLSGQRAFRGDCGVEVLNAILKDEPAHSPLAAIVPPAVDRIMRRCLEKRPGDRFQSAHDLALALGAIAGPGDPGILAAWNGSPAPPTPMVLAELKPRIVVLPFENTSPEPDTEFYADGITTEITDRLSKVGTLTVLSYRTALALKGTPKPIPVIARELKLRYVLEGTVRRAGDSLRISTRLVDGTSEAILWSGQFPGTLDDVFDMQEKVARGIVDGLELKLTLRESREVARRPITNARAYDCYLRARNELIRFTPEGVKAALQLLEKGREISGENALFDAGLGYGYFQLGNIGIQQDEAFTRAEACAEQALRLDPDTAEAYMVLGLVQQTLHGNQQKGVKGFREALRIDPNNVDTLFWLSLAYSLVGRTSAAMACADQLMQVNPLDVAPYAARMWAHYMDGRFDLSAESQRQVVGLVDVPTARVPLAYALAAAGRLEAALTELKPVGPVAGADHQVRLAHFLQLALRGKKDEMSELLTPEFVATTRRDLLYSLIVADGYAMLDEREPALEWLEHAVSRGLANYPYLSEYDPFVARLRSEPRFQTLMVRVKGEWKRFEE